MFVDTHLSLVMNVNPLRPLSLPEPLEFLGPDHSKYAHARMFNRVACTVPIVY